MELQNNEKTMEVSDHWVVTGWAHSYKTMFVRRSHIELFHAYIGGLQSIL